MSDKTIKKRIKVLAIIFVVILQLFTVCMYVYRSYCTAILDYDPLYISSSLWWFFLGFQIFVVLPLMARIKYYCKAANLREIHIVASCAFAFYLLGVIAMVAITVLKLVFPSFPV